MGGFRIRNQEAFDRGYTCPKCSLLLRNTVQFLVCGHRQCQSCVDEQQPDKIICFQCYMNIPPGQYRLDRGCHKDMQLFNIICAFCDWGGLLKDYETHLNHAHQNPNCNYCNQKFPSLDALNQHLQHTCEKILVPCPLHSLGCNVQTSAKDLSEHYCSAQHQKVLMECIRQLKGTNLLSQSSYTTDQFEETNKAMDELTTTSETLAENIQRLRNNYTRDRNLMELILRELSSLKQSTDNQDTSINHIHRHDAPLEQDMLITKQRLEENQMKLTDGIYIWRVDGIDERMRAAQSGQDIFIDSHPFYSSPTGYKMCLRLFLNGTKTARGRFISLQFILMRGEFDAILLFPFCFFVVISLLDQTNEQNHIVGKFQPEVLSRTCQRPQLDVNIIHEILEFAPLDSLRKENNSYIRENTMFIKTIIDFGQGLRNLVPYAVNLNPALPIPIQQIMIEKEKEKHRRV